MQIPKPDGAHFCNATGNFDGDSISVDVRVTDSLTGHDKIRLLGIDTPELYTGSDLEDQAGAVAKRFVADWLGAAERDRDGWALVARIGIFEKYGRILSRVWRIDTGEELGAAILNSGLGRIYLGKKREPWPTEVLEAIVGRANV